MLGYHVIQIVYIFDNENYGHFRVLFCLLYYCHIIFAYISLFVTKYSHTVF